MGFSKRMPDRRTKIFERDEFRCVYSGQVLHAATTHRGHVQPRAKRGDQSPGNLVTACLRCNTDNGGRAAWDSLRSRPVERDNLPRHAAHGWERLRRAVCDVAP